MDIKSQKSISGFPSPFAPEEEKSDKKYGLRFLKAMWDEHSNGGDNYFSTRDRIVSLRNWAMGTPPIDEYKDRDTLEDGNTSLSSKDFTPAAAGVMKNLLNISSNKLTDRPYNIDASAIDKDSTDKLDQRMKEMFGKVKIKAALKKMEEAGQDTSKLGKIKEMVEDAPDTIDEVQFDAELNWKTEEEESIENGIRYVLQNNSFDEIRKTISKDLHVIDSAGTWVRFDSNGNIKVEAIDRKNLIYSYFTKPDASDATYVGIVLEMTINELRQRSNGELSEEDLFQVARTYAGSNRGGVSNDNWTFGSYYQEGTNSNNYDHFTVLVLFGQFKSENHKVWREKKSKKGNGVSFDKVPSNYSEYYEDENGNKVKKRGVTEVIRKSVIDIYEGYLICDTNKCFGYKQKENVVKKIEDRVISTNPDFDIVFYTPNVQDTTSKGMAESMIPYVRQMINIEQKIQHLITTARPKGVAIDVSALKGVTAGMGSGLVDDKGLSEIYDKTGRLYYRSHDKNGKPQTLTGQPPIKELENGLSSDIERLIGIYNHWVSQMYAVSGINPSIDGMASMKGALVGIEQNRQEAYNSATYHYTSAYTNIIERTADRVALMIKHNLQRGVKVKGYKLAMGSLRVEVLKASKELTNAEIGIKIKYKPTENQKALFEESIKIALQQGQISVSGANRAREVLDSGSYKAANEYLAREVDKYMDKAHQRAMQQQQANGQIQIQSNQAAKAADAELMKMKHALEMEKLKTEYMFKIELEKAKASEGRLNTVLKGEVDQDLIKTSIDVNADTEVLNNKGSSAKTPSVNQQASSQRGVPQPNRSTPRPADDASKRAQSTGGKV